MFTVISYIEPNFRKRLTFFLLGVICMSIAGVAQLVERHVANVNVVGSNPISCSRFLKALLVFNG